MGFTAGAGTASKLKGPVTRRLLLSTSGWSYSVSCGAWRAMAESISAWLIPSRMSGLLAMDPNVMCGTVSYLKPLPTPSSGWASS